MKKLCLYSLALFCVYALSSLPTFAQPADSPWPMFRQDMHNTGRSDYAGPVAGKLFWSYITNGYIHSSCALASDGRMYVGTTASDDRVYCFSSTGSIIWSYDDFRAESSPAIDFEDNIYLHATGGVGLCKFDPSGVILWSYRTGSYYSSPMIGPDGIVYIGSAGNNVYALYSTGSLSWSYTTDSAIQGSPAIGYDQHIYVGAQTNGLYALNSTGSLFFTYSQWMGQSSPSVGSDGKIYFGAYSNNIYALYSDGSLAWDHTSDVGAINSSAAIGPDGRIYIGCDNNKIFALNSNGLISWIYTTGGDVRSSPVVSSDGIVYAGSNDKKIYAFGPSGSLLWTYETGVNPYGLSGIFASPSLGADHSLYIGAEDYVIYCFKDPTATPTPTRTPTLTPTPTTTPTPTFGETAAPGDYAYVTNAGSESSPRNTVSRIKLLESIPIVDKTITVGSRPIGIDIMPHGEYVLVANSSSNTVSVIRADRDNPREIKQIDVGTQPYGIAIDHDGRFAYVKNLGPSPETTPGSISVIDLNSLEVVWGEPAGDPITIGKTNCAGIAISNDNSVLAVSCSNDYVVQLFAIGSDGRPADPSYRVIGDSLGRPPFDVKFGPDERLEDGSVHKRLYISYTGEFDSNVKAVDLTDNSYIPYDEEGMNPVSISFRRDGRYFFTSNFSSNNVCYSTWNSSSNSYFNVNEGPLIGAWRSTQQADQFVVPCFGVSQGAFLGELNVLNTTTGGDPQRVIVGVNPYAVAIENYALPTIQTSRFQGITLFASPRRIIRSEKGAQMYIDWSLLPPAGIDFTADVIFAIAYQESTYYAATNNFRGFVNVNPRRISSIPRAVSRMRIHTAQSGVMPFTISAPGSFRFIVALTEPGSGRIVYMTNSNSLMVE
ncbi:MAG: PQQ-binding-like beta-propeller repeat protein [Candidatus Aureabacteria bacterium]|nr:PQQ-binding-like beta-propeller repeat protein [Candidatus Auribacterota bacterium]